MSSYGATPRCPRCERAVYAAEQVIGPGRKLYHKPCLSCASCKKRLDSFSLVEHDEEPYCKNCHTKTFGTRDLRSANLPHREEAPDTPTGPGAASPAHSPPASPASAPSFWAGTAAKRHSTGPPAAAAATPRAGAGWASPLRPTRALSPTGFRSPMATSFGVPTPPEESTHTEPAPAPAPAVDAAPGAESEAEEEEVLDLLDAAPSSPPFAPIALGTPARAAPSLPPRTPNYTSFPATVGRAAASTPSYSSYAGTPLAPTPTGTRYGRALGASPAVASHATGSPRWGGAGGGAPACARCAKTVYFAEQVKAVGRTWHKACLRCAECATALAPGRLAEREGEPFCQRCYSRLHGPQGSGYALLGKAGG